jgi:predicted lipid-binding transport protein (Tim44 family)
MISLGVLLVILGVGSLVLPSLGLQFTFMDWLDAYQPWAGIIVAAVGLITVLFGAQRRGRAAATVEAPPAAASPPAEASPRMQAPPPAQATPPAENTRPAEPPERSED